MKAKSKRLLIVLGVLIVVMVVAIIAIPKLNEEALESATDSQTQVFPDFVNHEVASITWRYAGEENTFVLKEGVYVYDGNNPENYDGTQPKYMVAAMKFLNSTKVMEEFGDLTEYGIDTTLPADAEVLMSDGTKFQLWLGDTMPMDDTYIYAYVGDGKLYQITQYTEPKFQYKLEDLVLEQSEGEDNSAA